MNTTIIKSSELREGDLIALHNCVVRLGEIKSRATAEPDYPVFWSTATVVEHDPKGIPGSYLDTAEDGSRTWQVQGNDRATWHKIGEDHV